MTKNLFFLFSMFAQFKREERRGDKRPFPPFPLSLWLTGQMHITRCPSPLQKKTRILEGGDGGKMRAKTTRERYFLASQNARLTSNSHIYTEQGRREGETQIHLPPVGSARMKRKFELMPSRPFSYSKGKGCGGCRGETRFKLQTGNVGSQTHSRREREKVRPRTFSLISRVQSLLPSSSLFWAAIPSCLLVAPHRSSSFA